MKYISKKFSFDVTPQQGLASPSPSQMDS